MKEPRRITPVAINSGSNSLSPAAGAGQGSIAALAAAAGKKAAGEP